MRATRPVCAFAFAFAFALTVATVPGIARAAGVDPVSAEALFRDGREASRRGDFATACTRFGESQRLDPAAGTLLNIAECEEKLGRIASAWAHLREALDALPPNDDRVATAAKQATALEPRLPRLLVRLAANAPADARVERDGGEVGPASLGVALPVDPGSHRLTVKVTGHHPRTYSVEVAESTRVEVEVEAGEPEAASPPTSVGVSVRWPGYALLGAGGLALGAGVVTGLLAIDRNSFMNDHCDAARACDQEGIDAGGTGRTFDRVSTISFIAAGLLVAGGVVWFVTHPRRESR